MSTEPTNVFRNPSPGAQMPEAHELEAELARVTQMSELPYLYGWKWYKWARAFFESRNPINLLCAANQISKSSTQIRKCIHWAIDKDEWKGLWREDVWAMGPMQFWYLYPTQKQVNAEWDTKWKLFMPRGAMQDDEVFGWKVMKAKNGDILGIKFNSGTIVYFKTYMQAASALQSGTCAAIFCDEELPIELFDELMNRISATDGYFHMVFTATLGQDYWRRAMEPEGEEIEELPDAHKQCVSLYEAMEYEDGTPSHWTMEKIKRREARCSTHSEVLKRIFGRFIVAGGRKYESFDLKRHKKPSHAIPQNWLIYEGVDIGGGGTQSHKSAIVFVAVRPDFRAGRVFLGWRGDGVVTTAGDVFQKHLELAGPPEKRKINVTQKWFDWGNKDFGEIATRAGDPFQPAEKSHEKGEDVINTLFKNDMLFIYEDPELAKLCAELAALKKDEVKRKAKDDFADALRYAVTLIPWDWSALAGVKEKPEEGPEEPLTDMQRQIKERRAAFEKDNEAERQRIEDEFAEANASYEGY